MIVALENDFEINAFVKKCERVNWVVTGRINGAINFKMYELG